MVRSSVLITLGTLVGRSRAGLWKYISFALRRGTIAQVTTLALDGRAQRAAEAELHAVNYHR